MSQKSEMKVATRLAIGFGTVCAIELAMAGKRAEAVALLLGPVREKQNVLFKAVIDSNALQKDAADETAAQALAAAQRDSVLLIALAGLMALIGGVVGFLITRNLSRALGAEPREVNQIVSRVADGDLTSRIDVRAGDTSSVMSAIKRMQDSLASVVGSVRLGSDSVATASAEIAQGNTDLSQRTEEQAAALEQTAATMGGVSQVGEAITQMDQVTQQNAALVEESAAAAESLRQQATQLVQTMGVFKVDGHASPAANTPSAPSSAPSSSSAPAGQVERRGPNRATNVTRPGFGKSKQKAAEAETAQAAPAKTGTDDWSSF